MPFEFSVTLLEAMPRARLCRSRRRPPAALGTARRRAAGADRLSAPVAAGMTCRRLHYNLSRGHDSTLATLSIACALALAALSAGRVVASMLRGRGGRHGAGRG